MRGPQGDAGNPERPHLVVSGSVIWLSAGLRAGGRPAPARGAVGHLVVSDSVIWLSAGGAGRGVSGPWTGLAARGAGGGLWASRAGGRLGGALVRAPEAVRLFSAGPGGRRVGEAVGDVVRGRRHERGVGGGGHAGRSLEGEHPGRVAGGGNHGGAVRAAGRAAGARPDRPGEGLPVQDGRQRAGGVRRTRLAAARGYPAP